MIKKFLKKIPLIYILARAIYWKVREIEEKILGTKVQEQYWKKRHSLARDDWGENKDWITGYWNSRSHPHREILIKKICQYPFESILEVGANCGPNLYLLAKRNPKAKIIGIDINEKAVEVGNKLFAKNDILNVKLFAGKADELRRFQDKSFDVVFTDAVLMYIGPDKIKKVVSEMERIAKKAIILVEHHSEEKSALGIYNKGSWLRDYKKLFQPYSSKIKLTKISPEVWGGNWSEFGYIIEIQL